MNTERTTSRAGRAIAAYLDDRGIRRQFIVERVGIRKDILSRMLRDIVRAPSERLGERQVRAIARVLDVPRSVEDGWLDLLDTSRESERIAS